LTLVSGNRLTVQETPEQIADLIRTFRKSVFMPQSGDPLC